MANYFLTLGWKLFGVEDYLLVAFEGGFLPSFISLIRNRRGSCWSIYELAVFERALVKLKEGRFSIIEHRNLPNLFNKKFFYNAFEP